MPERKPQRTVHFDDDLEEAIKRIAGNTRGAASELIREAVALRTELPDDVWHAIAVKSKKLRVNPSVVVEDAVRGALNLPARKP